MLIRQPPPLFVPRTTLTYSTILLDADGVLFDYDRAEANALSATLGSLGVSCDTDVHARYRRINAAAWKSFEQGEISQEELRPLRFAKLLDACGIQDVDPVPVGQRYVDELAERGDLIGGAEDTLRALKEHARLGLITNGIAAVQNRRLDLSGIRPYFDTIVISGEMGVAKPDPKIFEAACAQLGERDKRATLMVGDSLSSDIRGAAAYGVDACWIRPDDHEAVGTSGARYEHRHVSGVLALVG